MLSPLSCFPAIKAEGCRCRRHGRLWASLWKHLGWLHPKGADSMAVSGLRFGNASVGSEWATAVFLCMNGLKKQSSCMAQPM